MTSARDAGGRPAGGAVAGLWLLVGTPPFVMDIILPAQPAIGAALGGTALEIQWIVTAMLVGYGGGQIPFGIATDRWGRRPVAALSVALVCLGGLLALLADEMTAVLAGRLLQGLGAAGAGVTARAFARDMGPEGLPRLMSGMIAFLTAMTVLAPILGGLALSLAGWRLVVGLTVIYGLAGGLLLFMNLHDTAFPASQRTVTPLAQLRSNWRAMMAHRACRMGLSLVALSYAGYFTFISQGSTVAVNDYGLAPGLYGLLFAIPATANVSMALLNRRLVAHFGAARLLMAGALIQALGGGCLLMLAMVEGAGLPALWAAITLSIGGQGLLFPNATTIVLQPLPEAAGFGASIMGSLQVGAGIVASALAAALYDGGHAVLAVIMGAPGVLMLAILVIYRRELRA